MAGVVHRCLWDQFVPAPARLFDAEAWAEIHIALQKAATWSVEVVPPSWRAWDREHGYIVVRVDDRSWQSDRCNYAPDGEECRAVADLIEELAPLSARPADDAPAP